MSYPDLFSWEGKVVLVTGARRGLGRATALAFAEAGAEIAVCDVVIDDGELEAVTKEIKSKGRRAMGAQTDISQKTEVDSLIQRVVAELGTIDILVNNAAISSAGQLGKPPLFETPETEWNRVIDVNLKGYYFCAVAAGKVMLEHNKGSIISIASVDGISAGISKYLLPPELTRMEMPLFASPYQISKAGVIMLTRLLARQLGGSGIRVNAVAPTAIKTELTTALWSKSEILQYWEARMPLKRIAEPADIVGVIMFLASDAARYITGHTIVADGGLLA